MRLHPLREDLRGHLMLALHRSGRQAESLAVYAEGRSALADEAGLDPGAALRDLHAAILGDDPTLRLEDADLRARRHLPAPATALIGRRADRDELVRLLTDGTRLLTLTGPGGVGKTRLALHLAHEMAGACPDGVWFIELADLDDVRLVAPTVAEQPRDRLRGRGRGDAPGRPRRRSAPPPRARQLRAGRARRRPGRAPARSGRRRAGGGDQPGSAARVRRARPAARPAGRGRRGGALLRESDARPTIASTDAASRRSSGSAPGSTGCRSPSSSRRHE